MKNTKRLIVGAIAILSTMALFPASAQASVYDRYTEVAQFAYNLEDAQGTLDAQQSSSRNTALDEFLKKQGSSVDSNTIESYNKSQTVEQTQQATQSTQTQTTQVQEGWNVPNNDIRNVFYSKSGVKQVGWQKINNRWYYFEPSTGVLATNKWVQNSGNWYFVNALGDMEVSMYINGDYVDATGLCIASKNDSSKGNGVVAPTGKVYTYSALHTDQTLKSYSTPMTNEQIASLATEGKVGVKVTSERNQAGQTVSGLSYYLK